MGGKRVAVGDRDGEVTASTGLVGLVPSAAVAAVVVTYNRGPQLQTSLRALLSQSAPPGAIFVVDNASTDDTPDVVRQFFPAVRLVRLAENTGCAGGLASGLQAAVDAGFSWIWAFDDDDIADATALETLLTALAKLPRDTGLLAGARRNGRGGHWPIGGIFEGRQRDVAFVTRSATPVALDVVALSGTLVSGRMIDGIGLPRAEFFMRLQDLDYCLRAAGAGWRVTATPIPVVTAHASGSTGWSPPWRGYYQTRNELLIARSNRSARHLFWWSVRTAKFCAAALIHADRRQERVALRLRGAWDGWRGVTGRTVEPAAQLTPAPRREPGSE